MMPLRNIMDESYVVYLMTAGTKPPQPAIKYCPASAGATVASHAHEDDDDELISAGAPSSPTSLERTL
jgi:hypothetical protein